MRLLLLPEVFKSLDQNKNEKSRLCHKGWASAVPQSLFVTWLSTVGFGPNKKPRFRERGIAGSELALSVQQHSQLVQH